jgi:uncharacterized membrane protein
MIYTITIIFSVLVGINFLLLVFSCYKTVRSKKFSIPYIVKSTTEEFVTSQQLSGQVAATGS